MYGITWNDFPGFSKYREDTERIQMKEYRMKNNIVDAKTIVVKVGTSTLMHEDGSLNFRRIEDLVRLLADVKNMGKNVVLVSSGAVASGRNRMHIQAKPQTVPEKQALAAVGQVTLMTIYARIFAEYGQNIAQILLTRNIVEHDDSRNNVVNTAAKLFEMGVIPIVNENDSIATEEIEFGDNDSLSAIVATIIDADLLVIFSDIDGMYDDNPKLNPEAKLISKVDKLTPELEAMCKDTNNILGTGGMKTKMHAAEIANRSGIPMVLTNGSRPADLYQILEGNSVGTLFCIENWQE